jgi:ubiquinone/menaquinone biosynthesis C-methylase UbiE
MRHADNVFGGSVAELYESLMAPMLFEPYALDMVQRLRAHDCARVLEIGAGTGVLTRAAASGLPEHVTIVATDLNQAMLDRAAAVGIARRVEWRQADVGQLPFADGSFDLVVCQFAVMFFPDRPRAFSEMRRVLARGAPLMFSTWDRISENEFADVVTDALATVFPGDPPRFMARIPHGYHDRSLITRDLADAGFGATPRIETVAARSRAASPYAAAIAFCQGTPLRMEIESRDPSRLEEATDAAASALSARFGRGPIEARMQAHVIAIGRQAAE